MLYTNEEYLSANLSFGSNISLINADALNFAEENIASKEKPLTIISNLPYNISVILLLKWLDKAGLWEKLVLMFQKEVAQRIAAKHGNKTYGILSVLIQAFFTVDYLFEVHEQCFNPPPKVKSAVIRLTPRQQLLNITDEKLFFILVKTAFNQRRKMLRNAVKSLFDEETLKMPIFDKRAEQLSVEDFVNLAEALNNLKK